jgi:hypothetical protein
MYGEGLMDRYVLKDERWSSDIDVEMEQLE